MASVRISSCGLLVVAVVAVSGCGPRPDTLTTSRLQACSGPPPAGPNLRVVSFNIRAGLSSSVDAIATLLESLNPDVVALQEVDVGVERSGRMDQAAALAARLGAEFVFAPTLEREGGEYGIALLSRLPFQNVRRIELEAAGAFEPRVAIDAELCVGDRFVRVVNTHADVFPWANAENTRDLIRAVGKSTGQGLIVAGDLNASPTDTASRNLMRAGLLDIVGQHAEGPTFLGGISHRIDYVFADQPLSVPSDAQRIQVELSDHIPVVADLSLARLIQ